MNNAGYECLCIGVTAGASCLGVDTAVVHIRRSGGAVEARPLHAALLPYESGLRDALLAPQPPIKELARLHAEVGAHAAQAVLNAQRAVRQMDLTPAFVGFQPWVAGYYPPRTANAKGTVLLLGDPHRVAAITGIPVTSDFMSATMTNGGHGRLAISAADRLLFSQRGPGTATLHLGASARLCLTGTTLSRADLFETGPCNEIIDFAIRLVTGGKRPWDQEGAFAGKGKVIDELLDLLLDHPYYSKVPPKSIATGEFVLASYLRDALLARRKRQPEDLVATVVESVVFAITRAYTRIIKPTLRLSEIIVTGGGALNLHLLERLRAELSDIRLISSEEAGLPCTVCDAIRVAVLAAENLYGGEAASCPVRLAGYTTAN